MLIIISKLAIIQLSLFIVCLSFVFLLFFDLFEKAFLYNIYINSVIVSSFIIGLIISIIKIISYELEYKKLNNFDNLSKRELNSLRLLAPINLYINKNNKMLSQIKLQTLLSSIEKKVEESEHITKYLSGTLIFLGLFGTFWGLSQTIGNVSSIIDNLGIEQDASASFLKLKNSLKIPLEGMGIAFGCSLFGLFGSLILSFVVMIQKKISDKFLDKVEEWLSKHSIKLEISENNKNYNGQLFSMNLLEKTIETIYAFQHQLNDLSENRISLYTMQKEIGQKIADLSVSISKHQDLIKILGENQLELHKSSGTLTQFTDSIGKELIVKLNSIDNSINLMIQNSISNRDYIVNSLGSDIKIVSKTLSSMMRE